MIGVILFRVTPLLWMQCQQSDDGNQQHIPNGAKNTEKAWQHNFFAHVSSLKNCACVETEPSHTGDCERLCQFLGSVRAGFGFQVSSTRSIQLVSHVFFCHGSCWVWLKTSFFDERKEKQSLNQQTQHHPEDTAVMIYHARARRMLQQKSWNSYGFASLTPCRICLKMILQVINPL